MKLTIGRRIKGGLEVSSLEEASRVYSQLRDESLEGASTWPDGKLKTDNGTYRISYNGRVWDAQGNPVAVKNG